MMRVEKWDFVERKYRPYEIPDGWYCPLVLFDMETIVNCASCGRNCPSATPIQAVAFTIRMASGTWCAKRA